MGELDHIFRKDCTDCPLFSNAKSVCIPGMGDPETAKIMVVFESPTMDDDVQNKVATTEKDSLVKDVITSVLKADLKEFYFTHFVKCRVFDGRYATEAHMTACMRYLAQEIALLRPRAIIFLGANTSRYISQQDKPIDDLRDGIHHINYEVGDEVIEIPTVFTYSTGYMQRQPDRMLKFCKDFSRAYEIVHEGQEIPELTKVKVAQNFDEVREMVDYIKIREVVAFDIESAADDQKRALEWFREDFRITVISFTFQAGSSWVVPLFHPESPFSDEECEQILTYLCVEVFNNPAIRKIAHNVKFDMHGLGRYKLRVPWKWRGRFDDTMIMAHVLCELDKPFTLENTVSRFFPQFAGYKAMVAGFNWNEIALDRLSQYSGTDTDATFRLAVQLDMMLHEDERLYDLYRNLSMAVMKRLFAAEHRGMDINEAYYLDAIVKAESIMEDIVAEMRRHPKVLAYEDTVRARLLDDAILKVSVQIQLIEDNLATGKIKKLPKRYQDLIDRKESLRVGQMSVYEGINFGSPIQLGDLLYSDEGFGLTPPDGMSGTAKAVLNELHDKTGFVELLLRHRSVAKTTGTYLKGIVEKLDADRRIHTNFLQHGTASGRLSSADPNLQNIPDPNRVRDDIARSVVEMVKGGFIVPEGYTLVQADFSQAELRVIADFADESNMIEAYQNDKDLHALTGAKLAGYSYESFLELDAKVKKLFRTKAKAANFGLIYKISPQGYQEYAKTAYGVEMTLEQAEREHTQFFELYPNLLTYHALYIAKGRKFGYVRTLFGRKRHLPNILGRDNYKRAEDERIAVNSPIQGTAGEMTLFSIVLLGLRLDKRVLFVNTVHDSILFYIPDDLLIESLKIIKNTCENLPTLEYFGREMNHLGMKVDIETSKVSWKTLSEFDSSQLYV